MTGSYGFALNVILQASNAAVVIPFFQQNSKRMDGDFLLKQVTSYQTGAFSIILGTQLDDWFSDFVYYSTVLGNAVLPHFLPEAGYRLIRKGDFIVAKTKNETTSLNQITLLFEGELL